MWARYPCRVSGTGFQVWCVVGYHLLLLGDFVDEQHVVARREDVPVLAVIKSRCLSVLLAARVCRRLSVLLARVGGALDERENVAGEARDLFTGVTRNPGHNRPRTLR